MAHKALVNGTAYEVSGGRTLVNGTGYSIAGGRTLVNGTGYDISFSTPIGSLAVGSSVYLNESGSPAEYLVVNQGIPSNSNLYDASCDGTWLLRKDCHSSRVWDSSNNDYANSDIHAWLNGTFLGLFDSGIQSAIKQAKIPYVNGTGSGGSVASGANGLSTKVFLLSNYEVGFEVDPNITTYYSVDGACLSYFSGSAVVDSKRVAYLNNTEIIWWLRSAYNQNARNVSSVGVNGSSGTRTCFHAYGIRPALVLPPTVLVKDDDTIKV